MESMSLSHARAEIFRTLGHPARVGILESLQNGPQHARKLRDALNVEASTLNQHLATLRRATVVSATREKSGTVYSLSTDEVAHLLDAGTRMLQSVHHQQHGEHTDTHTSTTFP